MDVFEKLNKAFAGWYESLFGDSASEIRPKDVLRKMVTAMEDNRKEGLDNRIYVPNKYILQIAFENEDEREYLLSFLEKEELESALRKYMTQNRYFARGPLDFTLEEVTPVEGEEKPEKLTVKCKWDIRMPEKPAQAEQNVPYVIAELADAAVPIGPVDEEEHTVAAVDLYDDSTVAPPILDIKHVDGTAEQFMLTRPITTIGRSRRFDNDVVIDKDGMISKQHAKIVHTEKGFTLIDLDSTNGVWVNGERVTSASLNDGDAIRLGATQIAFHDTAAGISQQVARQTADVTRPRLVIRRANGSSEDFRLPSETIIGRALISDVRLDNSTVSQKHARVYSSDGNEFLIEDLGSRHGTVVNGVAIPSNSPIKLRAGDRITVGEVELRYEVD